jgi:hypothetical protein
LQPKSIADGVANRADLGDTRAAVASFTDQPRHVLFVFEAGVFE